MTLPLAPTMPTKIITIPKRGRSRGSLQKATPARMERVAVVVIVRAARGKHPRAEQTCKDGAERRQPERWRSAKQADCGPKGRAT
ncbi:hypothetical protein ECZU03_57540 [Escherichia coli]|nr:hypothetical protein ECZU03_57540 [Escherichia coli]